MIANTYRFHGHSSLKYVYKNASAVRSGVIVMKFVKNPHRKHTRMAVVVSKKVYKGATGRNRMRRRVYEILRHELGGIEGIHDLVFIIVSAEVRTMPAGDLHVIIKRLLIESGIYKNEQ